MTTQDRWVPSSKRQYTSAHLVVITNTRMRRHYPHFTGGCDKDFDDSGGSGDAEGEMR